jgi:hypothetical protein
MNCRSEYIRRLLSEQLMPDIDWYFASTKQFRGCLAAVDLLSVDELVARSHEFRFHYVVRNA